MDLEILLAAIRESLLGIENPRFYQSERGFQGEFLAQLSRRIPALIPGQAIVEQEHQKTIKRHGLEIRPDVIVHEPFNPAVHASRRDGNIAVIELKLRAGPKKAAEDFDSLYRMLVALDYPIGIFINVGHSRSQAAFIPTAARGRIVAFATRLTNEGVRIVEARPR